MFYLLIQPAWLLQLSITGMTSVIWGEPATFFQMAVAMRPDGHGRCLMLQTLSLAGYLVSAVTISWGAVNLIPDKLLGREVCWDMTVRFRQFNQEKRIVLLAACVKIHKNPRSSYHHLTRS